MKDFKKKKPRNPVLFLDAEDLAKYKKWTLLLKSLQNSIEDNGFEKLG